MIATAGPLLDLQAFSAWILFLIDFTLKGSLLFVLAGLCTSLMRSSSSALRHLVWTLAFAGVVLLPVAGLFVPSWQISVPILSDTTTLTARQEVEHAIQTTHSSAFQAVDEAGVPQVTQLEIETRSMSVLGPDSTVRQTLFSLLMIWLAGAAFLLFRNALDLARLAWIAGTAREIRGRDWQWLLYSSAARLNLDRPVSLRVSHHVTTPMVFGLFKPVILLPESFSSWSARRWEVVLLHELAHVKRHDYAVNLLMQVVTAVQWHNPMVWVAARHLRLERERACDDSVLRQGTGAVEYAEHLLAVARHIAKRRRLASMSLSMARPSGLKLRIQSILNLNVRREAVGLVSGSALALGAVGLLLPLAALQPHPPEQLAPDHRQVHQQVELPHLLADLYNDQRLVRAEAALALGIRKERASMLVLEEALNDPDPDVRGVAAWAMSEIGGSVAADGLRSHLWDSDPFVREVVIRGLGKLHDDRSICALVDLVRADDVQLRIGATWALGQFNTAKTVETLAYVLLDKDERVRHTAEQALVRSTFKDTECILLRIMLNEGDALHHRITHVLNERHATSNTLDGMVS